MPTSRCFRRTAKAGYASPADVKSDSASPLTAVPAGVPRRAFITGLTGQDGSYLAELLLAKGYEVHGMVRPGTDVHTSHLAAHVHPDAATRNRLIVHEGRLEDAAGLRQAIGRARPDELYHLAGQSHVGRSFDIPEATCELIALGTLRVLEIVRTLDPVPRLFHASSSEVFGSPVQSPQDETTPLAPLNPYGCAKAFATQLVSAYRRRFGLFAVNGILFNHESPRRSDAFVVQKICRGAVAVVAGRQRELVLGDLNAARDWGDARDYVRAMWLALQAPAASDYVIATGVRHSVRDVAQAAFAAVGLDWQVHVRSDPALLRPGEPVGLVGNPARAKRELGWQAEIPFATTIRDMTEAARQR